MAKMSSREAADARVKKHREQQNGKQRSAKGSMTEESRYLNMEFDLKNGTLPKTRIVEFEQLKKERDERIKKELEERNRMANQPDVKNEVVHRRDRTVYKDMTPEQIKAIKTEKRKERRLARRSRAKQISTVEDQLIAADQPEEDFEEEVLR
jgi:(2Fe-2S) ferredoxin